MKGLVVDEIAEKNNFLYVYLGLVWVAAFALMWWITPYGSGVSPDSTVYIRGAKSLLSGRGYVLGASPITHFPPLYSVTLAAVGLFQSDLAQAARFLGAVLFGVNAVLLTLAVHLATGRSRSATILSTLYFLSSTPFIAVHSMAWSEPLFIALLLACLILLSKYIAAPTLSLFIASSLSLGFALATRYAGVAFLLAASAALFVSTKGWGFWRRLRNTLIWTALACVPLGIFLLRNAMFGSPTDRGFTFHRLSVMTFVRPLVAALSEFVVPSSPPRPITLTGLGLFAAALVVVLLLATVLVMRYIRDVDWRSVDTVMAVSCLFCAVVYVLFLFVSISFFDAATPVDRRILSPFFAVLIIGVFALIWNVWPVVNKPAMLHCFILLVVLSAFMKTGEAANSAINIRREGSGYTSREWHDSQSIAFVRTLGKGVRMYTNAVDAVSFLSERNSYHVPVKMEPSSREPNASYLAQVDAMCRDITEKGALLVYFSRLSWEGVQPSQAELESACPLPVLKRFPDGTIYGRE